MEELRNNNIKGNIVRSTLRWLHECEKPITFFCNLESKNYVEKTIKKVQLKNGSIVTNQNKVLHHIREYHVNLFENKDDKLSLINFEDLGLKSGKNAINVDLGLPITINELGSALKQLKHNKTLGIDGITSEFLIIVWGKIKILHPTCT